MSNKKWRVKPQYAGRPEILLSVGTDRFVNFGSRGAFIDEREATKTSIAREILYDEPTQADFEAVAGRGHCKFIEQYDEAADKSIRDKVKAKRDKITKAQKEREEAIQAEQKAAEEAAAKKSAEDKKAADAAKSGSPS